jgi:hypothetical protein
LIPFQGEAFGFVTPLHIKEVANVETYARLKHNAEKCRHPKNDSRANTSGVVAKTTLVLIVILKCLLF